VDLSYQVLAIANPMPAGGNLQVLENKGSRDGRFFVAAANSTGRLLNYEQIGLQVLGIAQSNSRATSQAAGPSDHESAEHGSPALGVDRGLRPARSCKTSRILRDLRRACGA